MRGIPSGFRENPKSYLYRAAVNVSLNTIRSRKRHVFMDDPEKLDTPVELNLPNSESPIQGRLVEATTEQPQEQGLDHILRICRTAGHASPRPPASDIVRY